MSNTLIVQWHLAAPYLKRPSKYRLVRVFDKGKERWAEIERL